MNRPLRPILALATAALTIGAGISGLCGLPAVAQSQGKAASAAASQALPPRSLIQKLRDFLGLNPPVAVGAAAAAQSWRCAC